MVELVGGPAGDEDSDALDEGEQHASDDGRPGHGGRPVAHGQDGARHGATRDGVPGVLLLSHVHHRTVDGGEQAAPHAEVTWRGKGGVKVMQAVGFQISWGNTFWGSVPGTHEETVF